MTLPQLKDLCTRLLDAEAFPMGSTSYIRLARDWVCFKKMFGKHKPESIRQHLEDPHRAEAFLNPGPFLTPGQWAKVRSNDCSRATAYGVGLMLFALVAWGALGDSDYDRLCVDGHPRPRVPIEYPIPARHSFERDHMTPRCLGGANDASNVWYQPIEEARRKDVLERAMCDSYCAGKVSLSDAQKFFSSGKWRQLLEMKVLLP